MSSSTVSGGLVVQEEGLSATKQVRKMIASAKRVSAPGVLRKLGIINCHHWGVAIMAMALIGAGCTTTRDQMGKRLQEEVGRLSYPQAIEKFGTPTSVKTGNKVIAAQWIMERRMLVNIPIAAIPAGFDYMWYAQTQQWVMKLTFDSRTKLLTKWEYQPLSLLSGVLSQGYDPPRIHECSTG